MIKLPPGVDSKFRYVLLAAKRARQLQSGSPPLMPATGKKPTRVAREELELRALKFEILPPVNEGEEVSEKKKRK
jgi:DNA-directed RNA polymerase subunit omega